ncbi:MAG: hypothetical protein Rubg2KO_00190 [Rubricoccaceae bacterium]
MRLGFVVLSMTLAWAGCDSAPGAVERTARPVIASVEVTPLSDSLETAAPTASIPLTVRLALEGEGPIAVRVLVRYAETDTLVTSSMETVQPGTVELAVPLTLPRGAIGDYAVSVVTEGPGGRAGDEASARFRFKAASLGPPSVTVDAPTTVTAPASGSRPATLPIVATATDPDGRENVALVLIQDVDGFVLGRIYDEGPNGRSDDDTAGDGRYSGSLQIPSGFPAGTYTLAATAVDRAGEISAPASFTFTVR